VRIPIPPSGTGIAHRKLSFHERPAATVACAVRVAEGAVVEARIAVGSVGARPVRARAAEARLAGTQTGDTVALLEAAVLAAGASEAVEDANGSAEYKTELVRVLVERCFGDAIA
jgi:CO/xanthine dehydrogenase FAD-binding subunit